MPGCPYPRSTRTAVTPPLGRRRGGPRSACVYQWSFDCRWCGGRVWFVWRYLQTGHAGRPDVAPDLGTWSAALRATMWCKKSRACQGSTEADPSRIKWSQAGARQGGLGRGKAGQGRARQAGAGSVPRAIGAGPGRVHPPPVPPRRCPAPCRQSVPAVTRPR